MWEFLWKKKALWRRNLPWRWQRKTSEWSKSSWKKQDINIYQHVPEHESYCSKSHKDRKNFIQISVFQTCIGCTMSALMFAIEEREFLRKGFCWAIQFYFSQTWKWYLWEIWQVCNCNENSQQLRDMHPSTKTKRWAFEISRIC